MNDKKEYYQDVGVGFAETFLEEFKSWGVHADSHAPVPHCDICQTRTEEIYLIKNQLVCKDCHGRIS